jgi:transcriptional regulator with XRE-family HTH domain
MAMHDKINLFMAKKGMTQADLAQAIGVSRQAVQKWTSGASDPKGTNLAKLCEFFGTSADCLKDPQAAGSSVGVYAAGDPIPEGYVEVPEFNIDFGAGAQNPPTWEVCQNPKQALYRIEFFQRLQIRPDQCRRIKVVGDSMEPTLYNGDTVLIVERNERLVDGAIYAFSLRDDLMIKRLYRRADGSFVIHSDNEERYSDEVISPDRQESDYFRIYGRAIERSGPL